MTELEELQNMRERAMAMLRGEWPEGFADALIEDDIGTAIEMTAHFIVTGTTEGFKDPYA